ncbi:MAG: NAD(P)-dependent oxidoreductase [Kosmotogaceae bacterium]
MEKIAKIGIIGTGFIGTGLKRTIQRLPDMNVACILTQRNLADFPGENVYTNSIQELIKKSDLVVECNGNPVYATEVLCQVMDAGLPVVTMDAELHVTTGTYLAKKGLITEAEGDQPGALAALNRKLVDVGFTPLVYGNLKGFLNLTPTPEEMAYWAEKQGISVEQVTGATDGTKIQIEQVFVANGLGAVIGKQGLYGYESMEISEGAHKLARRAKEIGQPISDYLLCSPKAKHRFPAGVFITVEYDSVEAPTFEYLKLGEGPFYTMLQSFHLIYLEIPVTIRQVLQQKEVLLNNGPKPKASVCTIAKHALNPGTVIKREDRNFHVRGEAIPIADAPNHIPIGLMYDVVIKRKVEPGQMIVFDDIEIQESQAYHAWKDTLSDLR